MMRCLGGSYIVQSRGAVHRRGEPVRRGRMGAILSRILLIVMRGRRIFDGRIKMVIKSISM